MSSGNSKVILADQAPAAESAPAAAESVSSNDVIMEEIPVKVNTIFKNLKELFKWQNQYFKYNDRHADFHRKTEPKNENVKDTDTKAWPNKSRLTLWNEWGLSTKDFKKEYPELLKPGPENGIKALIADLTNLEKVYDYENENGQTLLHVAVRLKGYLNIVQALLENKTKVHPNKWLNKKDKRGWTPLHYACERRDNDAVEVVRALLEHPFIRLEPSFACAGDWAADECWLPFDIASNKHTGYMLSDDEKPIVNSIVKMLEEKLKPVGVEGLRKFQAFKKEKAEERKAEAKAKKEEEALLRLEDRFRTSWVPVEKVYISCNNKKTENPLETRKCNVKLPGNNLRYNYKTINGILYKTDGQEMSIADLSTKAKINMENKFKDWKWDDVKLPPGWVMKVDLNGNAWFTSPISSMVKIPPETGTHEVEIKDNMSYKTAMKKVQEIQKYLIFQSLWEGEELAKHLILAKKVEKVKMTENEFQNIKNYFKNTLDPRIFAQLEFYLGYYSTTEEIKKLKKKTPIEGGRKKKRKTRRKSPLKKRRTTRKNKRKSKIKRKRKRKRKTKKRRKKRTRRRR